MATMVSLVSEQTVPNILAIWHFQPDKLLFISTEEMERKQKIRDIVDTLNRRNTCSYQPAINTEAVIVVEDSLYQNLRKLEEWVQGKEDEFFIVNLTGGTKLMAIAVFEFFKNYENKMIYIPINKNEFISTFPIRSPKPTVPLTHRLTVDEYLCAYGLRTVSQDKVTRCIDAAKQNKQGTEWIVLHYNELEQLLSVLGQQLREKRGKTSFHCSMDYHIQNNIESEFFDRFHFRREENHYSKSMSKNEIAYFTGGWLEDFCYNAVADLVGEGVDDAAINTDIRNVQGRENEFDVIFTSENALYTIECKSLEQYHDKKFDVLYKIGALQNEFGLRAQSYLVTTSSQLIHEETGEIKQHIKERARQFRTKIIGPEQLKDLKDILARRFSVR
ncbi:MAG: DUF1887 family CARF protein [Syntrophales bacterium]|jgi:hypothetical protein|nr:DUF1887 family CARF protein [Syntrophales bacterium]